ncbi:MAG: helix-hairpin-helix domain-containing protein, partial [Lentisphaeraceae bacterium]|nr:helix-hairpin-helix domain-containing protein [Lentisphaeraceae bacterium]
IPRERVLQSLSEGVFNLSAGEVDNFAGTNAVRNDKINEKISIDLALIMGLIPPEWFALQGQDTSQTELLSNMRDVFDDSTFEEAAKEQEQKEPGLGETVVDADREAQDNSEEISVETQDEEDEEEISIEVEDEGESLITGGIFSKMNNLFEDDEDEEEVSIEVEDEEEKVDSQALTEDEDEELAPPIIEEAIEPLTSPEVIESTVEEPVVEEEPDTLQTITVNRDDSKIFDDQRLAKEQLKEHQESQEPDPQLDENKEPTLHSMPTLVQLTPPPKVVQNAETIEVKEKTPEPIKASAPEEDLKNVPDAGKVTYRPVNDDVPDVSESAILRPSTAPNGIDINRSNLADLCRLHSAGEKLAQTLIEYREQNGDFKSINDLINVPGIGSAVYKSLTGLRSSSDLVAAERRINKSVGLDTDKDYPLRKIIKEAQEKFDFKSIILSDKDGFEICSSGDKSLLESNSELLAATTPQLFKKTRHFLKQSLLPHPEVFTFYLEDTPVTFGIADEVFMVMVHSSKWPDPKHMKQCRTLINELAWFCSYRAIV